MSEDQINHQAILISGESGTGKSAALRNIPNQQDWFYLNAEAGKELPFRNTFSAFRIADPYQVWEAFDVGKDRKDCRGIIIDTSTFLMDMFESQYIIPAADTQKAWGLYAQFWKRLMQEKVVAFNKPVIILAHTLLTYDEKALENRVQVPVKGALKNNGIEAYFSTVVSTKRVELRDLKEMDPNLCHIEEDDEILGFKYVFQTRLTKATKGERIRSPMGLFDKNQTYMDNDAQLLLDHLNRFYKNP